MNTEIILTSCQKRAFKRIKKLTNLFITGNAGTGKSTLMSDFIKWFEKYQPHKTYKITSSTGSSALLIQNASTIHSYLGATKSSDFFPLKNVMSLLRRNPDRAKDLYYLDLLIIDEISMISNIFFDKIAEFFFLINRYFMTFYEQEKDDGINLPNLDYFYKTYLNHNIAKDICLNIGEKLQLILCGDFRQLPPVKSYEERNADYAFKSSAWKINNIKTEILQENCRVSDDDFFNMLLKNAAHANKNLSDIYIQKLNETRTNNIVNPTKIFCTKDKRDKENYIQYQKLKYGSYNEVIYRTEFSKNSETRNWLKEIGINNSDIADISLIVGAVVLITYNIDLENGLANGTKGVVTELTNTGPKIKYEKKDKNGFIEVIIKPIEKRYNINNKCQENDECPVPASRNKTGDGVPTHCWEHGRNMEPCNIYVKYYPVMLGYAMTTHRSQGMTLEGVEFDPEDVFLPGQAYVAISRVKKLEHIKIIGNINKNHFLQDEAVMNFYK